MLVRLSKQPYDSEDLLQGLLEDHPDLLAGEQMSPADPRRWVLVAREVGIPATEGGGNHWSLDHLFLDQDGVPTIVEVKRSSDTRIRREVIGQMLDYAANAVDYWRIDTIRSLFERTCEERGRTAEEVLQELVGGDVDEPAYWSQVKTNLMAGRIRLVFVADAIPPELQRIIEFLNRQMDPACVVGVEVPQFVGEGLQTLVPRVVGLTAEARERKSTGTPRRRLNREEFLASYSDAHLSQAVDSFLSGCERLGLVIAWGPAGCSLRMRLASWSKRVSVAWVFPPDVPGWMGLRGITVGLEPAVLSPDDPRSSLFQEYMEAIGGLAETTAVDRTWVAGAELSPEAAPAQLPEVLNLMAQLREGLEELEKERGGTSGG